eukprot:snap_masked-scaffold_5-processed-gene-6.16-mRNA-1 protein AED:1.00 eAED:1.00 QI:0/0/0/0/1/1/2/0/87
MLELNFESGLGDVVIARIPNLLLLKTANAGPRFPTLAKVARKFLAIQTSSISSERAFFHGRFEYKGKENMSDQTFMMRMNAREWMKS